LKRLDAVLFCVTIDNLNESIVSIDSFVKSNNAEIIISYINKLDTSVEEYLKTVNNKITYLKFMQDVGEDKLVIKSLETLIDSNYIHLTYFRSTTIINRDIERLITLDMGEALIASCQEYTFAREDRAKPNYKREDPKFNIRFEKYGMDYINADVIVINLKAIRRHPKDFNNLSDRMHDFKYSIEPCLSEFITYLFKDCPKKVLNRDANDFGDKYLFNIRPYNKMIRSNFKFYSAAVQNFSECRPWTPSLKLSRRTLQYSVGSYEKHLKGLEEYLSVEFVNNIKTNSIKWGKRLGNLPETFNKYYGG